MYFECDKGAERVDQVDQADGVKGNEGERLSVTKIRRVPIPN